MLDFETYPIIAAVRTKEDFLSELDELYKSVSSQFKYSAERMYSEAVLDLENLFGNSETISLRNAMYKESQAVN